MRLLITGATGLIGRRLVVDRLERGDHVVLVSRDGRRAARLFAADANRYVSVVQGDPSRAGEWQAAIDGCDGVVHLAGAGIADRRWTAAYKAEIVASRIESTRHLVDAIERATRRPRVLVSGSAVGYYGDAGDRPLDESSPPGNDFLAKLTVLWEAQAWRATDFGLRVVLMRTATVLDDRGGALPKMLKPFQWFLGGPIGNGRQYMPWIHWRDLIGLIDLALATPTLAGPMNAAAPHPIRNRDFARAIGAAIARPSGLPMPRAIIRLALGEVARYVAASQQVLPNVALQHGYSFLHGQIEPALASLLGESDQTSMPDAMPNVVAPSAGMNVGPPVQHGAALQRAPVAKREALPVAPIRLLAIDVDGTLLRSDGTLPQGVVQACRSAERIGCAVVLATARPPRGMRPIVQALDLASPTINYNGAVIWNPLGDQPQFHEPLRADVVRQIIDVVRTAYPDIAISIERLDRWYTDRVEHQWLGEANGEVEPDGVGPLEGFLDAPVTKLNLLGDPVRMEQIRELVRERFWRTRAVAVFLTDPRLIQIMHPMVDKGIALQRVANRMSLSRESVMAIGDASNDMGMIEWAGFGVAVENAYPAVRMLADAIVPSNDDLGVARAIQRYVLAPPSGRRPPFGYTPAHGQSLD